MRFSEWLKDNDFQATGGMLSIRQELLLFVGQDTPILQGLIYLAMDDHDRITGRTTCLLTEHQLVVCSVTTDHTNGDAGPWPIRVACCNFPVSNVAQVSWTSSFVHRRSYPVHSRESQLIVTFTAASGLEALKIPTPTRDSQYPTRDEFYRFCGALCPNLVNFPGADHPHGGT